MTLHELLEAAQLDALGLLDAEEQQAFEKAFLAAAPAVRDQVRREQSRLCRLETVLPDVAPPADLRQRVLNAVATAQAAETLSDLRESRGVLHPAGREGANGLPERRVSRLWRAAAVGLAAASVVFGVTTLQLRNEYTSLAAKIEAETMMNSLVGQFRADHVSSAIFDSNTKRLIFASSDPKFQGKAALWFNSDWESARLFAMNLPTERSSSYKLVARDRSGRVSRVVAEFDAGAGMVALSVGVDPARDYSLALVVIHKGSPTSEGQTVLESAPLSNALAIAGFPAEDFGA